MNSRCIGAPGLHRKTRRRLIKNKEEIAPKTKGVQELQEFGSSEWAPSAEPDRKGVDAPLDRVGRPRENSGLRD
jgi:hypothetical protein